MIELENGQLTCFINRVIYNGRVYEAPIKAYELMYYDAVFDYYAEKNNKRIR